MKQILLSLYHKFIEERKNKEIRLNQLKVEKFLTMKTFKELSENMHYETFKYLNCKDLLGIRSTNLGGYQLTSNILLRSRIKTIFGI